jgi:hypothetical protein
MLCGFKDLPEHLQFNPDVWEGYRRCPSTLTECTTSIFQLHNESAPIQILLLAILLYFIFSNNENIQSFFLLKRFSSLQVSIYGRTCCPRWWSPGA